MDENKKKPFFLYFATTTPHGPYEVERSWGADRRITPYGFLDEPVEILSDKETILKRLEEADLPLSKKDIGSRGNVLWLDDALGALLNKLKEIGEYENTIIVFFNDHGQAAKGTVYQGGTENPSIIWKYGGFPCGNETDALVSNIDFAPTLLDLLDVEYTYAGFDGVSFAPVLEGNTEPVHSSLYFEMGYSRGVRKGDMKYIAVRYPEYAINFSLEERQALLDKFNARQKLQGKKIHHTDPSIPYSHLQLIPGGGDAEQGSIDKYSRYYDGDQLYDLSLDPHEQINLFDSSEYKNAVEDLQKELALYLEKLPGSFGDFAKDRVIYISKN
jgi:arylsulfatase A-like enzyme